MAHNFRIIFTDPNRRMYVSKAGNNATGDGSPDLPYLALQAGNSGTQMVAGTGVYALPANFNFGGGRPGWADVDIFADGTVKFLGDNITKYSPLAYSGGSFNDIFFEQFAGYIFREYPFGNPVTYNRCQFKITDANTSTGNSYMCSGNTVTYNDCIFFGVNLAYGVPRGDTNTGDNAVYNRCLFFNTTFGAGVSYSLDSCYLNATSSICCKLATNCNVDPNCNTAAGYGLNINGGGFKLAQGTNISQNPQFNSVPKEDFTLQASSPHILRGIGPSQYRYANSWYLTYTGNAGDAASISNVQLRSTGSNIVVPLLYISDGTSAFEFNSQQGMVLMANASSTGRGSFITGRIPFADVPREMTIMLLKAGLNFNTSFPATENQFNTNQPEVYNNNVPDNTNYAAGDAGRNPNRLGYAMRWSQKPNPNQILENIIDWITGKSFVGMEWNTKPLWNPATYDPLASVPDPIGNGDARFIPSQGQSIVCTFYQMYISLTNLYFS